MADPAEGRAPHARIGRLGFHRGIVPRRHRAFDCPLYDHVMPRLEHVLAMRTRRPRPSEKIAFRVIPGSSPQGHPCWASPPRRGGLRTPAGKVLAPFGHVPVGDPAPPGRTVKKEFLGTRLAIPCGRTECVPPRKPPFASSPGLRPEGLLPIAWPSRGGAGSARPQGRHGLDRGICPVGQPASCLIIGWKRHASAFVGPRNADAQSASLRENRP